MGDLSGHRLFDALKQQQCAGQHQKDGAGLGSVERAIEQRATSLGVAPNLSDVDRNAGSDQADSGQVAGAADGRLTDEQGDGKNENCLLYTSQFQCSWTEVRSR